LHARPHLFHDPCIPSDARAVSDELQSKVNHALDCYFGDHFPHLRDMHAAHAATQPPALSHYSAGRLGEEMSTLTNPGRVAYDRALDQARRQEVVGDHVAFRKLLVQECLRIERDAE
jgi:hypothetical protein